jgi:hypothetical protein
LSGELRACYGPALLTGRTQMGGTAVTRRLILVLSLVAALTGSVVATATADTQAEVSLEIRLPLPALPIGPGPLYPFDS